MKVDAKGALEVRGVANTVLKGFSADPTKLNALLGEGDKTQVIRGLLGSTELSDAEVEEVSKDVLDNNVIKLFTGAEGSIDAADLMNTVGDLSDNTVTRAKGIAALFDGKLDINDALLLVSLLSGKGLGKVNASTALSLLAKLVGGSSSSNSSASLLTNVIGSMLGGSSSSNTSTAANAATGLLGTLLGGNSKPASTSSSGTGLLGALLGGNQKPKEPTQEEQMAAMLQQLLAGNTSSNNNAGTAAANQLVQSLLGSGATATNSNGSVNLNTLFNLAGNLLQ
ncbi:MAG: hypothetical protein IKE21_00950 [Erysipelotrichaceae bacterium]|nr:hypothetical protein [Erysipelotrichaceae bacterium]